MKANIKVEGPTKRASFTVDTEQKIFHRTSYEELSPGNPTVEIFRVSYYDPDYTEPLFTEPWAVLYGTPSEIVKGMEEDHPITIYNTDNIFDEMTMHPSNAILCITCEILEKRNRVYRLSKQAEFLHKSQDNIVANLYGLDRQTVLVVAPASLENATQM